MPGPEFLTVDETIAALEAAAFTRDDEEGKGRRLVHCFIGVLGADWDVADAVEMVKTSTERAWVDHPLDHDLAVLSDDGRVRCFAVTKPKADG